MVRPPPNPAKQTDSRFREYAEQHGRSSWELDALPPTVIDDLLTREIGALINDREAWAHAISRENRNRKMLKDCGANWTRITAALQKEKGHKS